MNFDAVIDRIGTHCSKWDEMQKNYGVSPEDGIAMWVADMDFRPPQAVQDALENMTAHGVYGYFGNDAPYRKAICWWMETRHGWNVDPADIFTTHGLVNGTGLCVDAFTAPGEAVVLFTPVYHAFARVIKAGEREVRECPLVIKGGRYEFDFDAYDALMTGNEKMLVLCSPHNPGGRVWTKEELEGVIAFAKRHDLVLVSDEIHHDLILSAQKHIPMATLEGVEDRLVMMTAATKTFNIAGAHTGNVIIKDPVLKAKFAARMGALGISPNSFGMHMVTAAYSAEGAAWVDELCDYFRENARLLEEGLNAIPGVKVMPLEATYLSWVDFSGTGMEFEEVKNRIQNDAKVAANYGATFGTGGETFMRFNFATPRVRVVEAVKRIQAAFADLQ